jgi:hypothetical protein
VPSLASHDVTGSARGSFQASLTQLPGVFGINRNRCSASGEISVRLDRKSAFGFPRNGRSFSAPTTQGCRSTYAELIGEQQSGECSEIRGGGGCLAASFAGDARCLTADTSGRRGGFDSPAGERQRDWHDSADPVLRSAR